jgi:hypothetical protein
MALFSFHSHSVSNPPAADLCYSLIVNITAYLIPAIAFRYVQRFIRSFNQLSEVSIDSTH